ncbi:MAG TPA: UvrD-helicase domain-containing protein [Pirellulales bacterium]|nr:UvrD-helicase domain-containing protein [Pirellulales bacterium]
MIRASAGTGKTFQLSNRYLGLAAAGTPPDQILAATFTRKAAGEILERILTRLAEACDDREKCGQLARFLERPDFDRRQARQTLAALVHQLHRLRILTLDAFFAQLARSFDLELGLVPGWRIIEESADGRLRREAIQAALASGETHETLALLRLLTKGEATRSVSDQLQSLVTGLYGYYLETTAEAWDSLPRPPRLTDEKLSEALDALEQYPLADENQMAKARAGDLAAARAGDWPTFISKGLASKINAGEETYHKRPIAERLVEVYRSLLRHARGVLVGQLADQTQATWQFLDRFDREYRRLKVARRALRFDDITRALGNSALCQRVTDLSFRLDTRIAHVLLDEFQDTSLSQWNVLRPLVADVMEGSEPSEYDGYATDLFSKASSFFCVGDVKQAIYGWRGGVAELFDALGRDWPHLEQPSLTCSRRSAQPIIDTVNLVFDALASNPAIGCFGGAANVWQHGFESHTTAQRHLAGHVRMVAADRCDEDQKRATLTFAADEVARLVATAPGKSIGVLVRDNDAVATLIYELRRREVAASEEGGNPLTDSPAVSVVLSLLTVADHPGDTAARYHVANSPLAAYLGLTEQTDFDDDGRAARLSLKIRQQLLTHGYGPTICLWSRKLAPHCDSRDSSRLLQLVELAYRFEPEAGLRTRDFVEFVTKQRVEAPSPADVRVMTIHQAKGLQFDIVVLPQLDVGLKGQTPPVVVGRPEPTAAVSLVCRYANESLRSMLPDEVNKVFDRCTEQVVRESLCVLYVALTRPIHALHLIIAPSKENEKQLPALFSGMLRAALTDGGPIAPRTVVYEHGVREWHRETTEDSLLSARSDAPDDAARTSSFRVTLAPSDRRRRRALERESPSGLAHAAHVDLAARMVLDDGRAANRGSTFHAWFEQIEWLDGGEPDDATLRHIGAYVGASPREIDEWLAQFRTKLRNPRLRAALSRRCYLTSENAPWSARPEICADLATFQPTLEIFRERPFAVRLRDTLLSGTFDRLVLVRGPARLASSSGTAAGKERTEATTAATAIVAAEVLDFKTDAVSPTDPQAVEKIAARYRPQLLAYREAVCTMFGLPIERVIARLMVIEADQLVEVE